MKKFLLVTTAVFNMMLMYGQGIWQPIGDLKGTVHSLFVYNGELYAGGRGVQNFSCGYSKNYVMKWNGFAWDSVGTDLQNFSTLVAANVNCFAEFNNELYIGGMFGNNFVLKWDGNAWVSVDNGFLGHSVQGLEVFNNELYASESMYTPVGSDSIQYVAKWNGIQWTNVGFTKWGQFGPLKTYNNELYVGGDFNNINNDTTIGYDIAKWDGLNWSTVTGGTALCYTSIGKFHESYDNKLIATGKFSSIGGIQSNSIGEWNGNVWNSECGALSYGVSASTYYDSTLYIATMTGNPAYYSFVKIKSHNCQFFGDTLLQSIGVYDMIVYNSDIYIAGNNMDNNCRGVARLSLINGIQENKNKEIEVNIFPNPFCTQTTLQTDNLLHNATFTLDNCFGQTVVQIKNLSGQTIVFNRDNLSSGLYFVRLTEENKTIAVDKLVITDK